MRNKEVIYNTNYKPLKNILDDIMQNILQNREANNREKITSNQLTTIFSITREKGISQREVTSLIKSHFNKDILHLSLKEASEVIRGLLQ